MVGSKHLFPSFEKKNTTRGRISISVKYPPVASQTIEDNDNEGKGSGEHE